MLFNKYFIQFKHSLSQLPVGLRVEIRYRFRLALVLICVARNCTLNIEKKDNFVYIHIVLSSIHLLVYNDLV